MTLLPCRILHTGAYPFLGGWSNWFFYIGAFGEWYGDHWIVSCCPHCIPGHNHIKGHCFISEHSHFANLRLWDLTFCLWLLLLMDYGIGDISGSFFSAYLVDLWYPLTFYFIPFLITFTLISILPELNHYFLLAYFTITSYISPYSCRSFLESSSRVFIHFLNFRFNIFHDSEAWQITNLLVMMFSFW